MSHGCKITDQDGVYYMTFQVVEWVDIFTRQNCRDIIVESLQFCQREKGMSSLESRLLPWMQNVFEFSAKKHKKCIIRFGSR
jgi:hypothetical protein